MLCCMTRKTDAFPQSPVLSTTLFFLPRGTTPRSFGARVEVLTCRVNTCSMFFFCMYVRTRWPEEGASRTICARSTIIIIQRSLILILILILNGLARGALRSRTTSLLGEDSYCRGSIVNIRFGRCRALLARPESSKTL